VTGPRNVEVGLRMKVLLPYLIGAAFTFVELAREAYEAQLSARVLKSYVSRPGYVQVERELQEQKAVAVAWLVAPSGIAEFGR
jgi:hypothetical protein